MCPARTLVELNHLSPSQTAARLCGSPRYYLRLRQDSIGLRSIHRVALSPGATARLEPFDSCYHN